MQLESSVTLFDDEKVETRFAQLQITADGITSEVSRKVGNDEVISRINQSAEGIQIQANKVNIEGATIFSSGRLSQSNLNAAYDSNGAATNSVNNLKNDLSTSSGTTVIHGGHITTGTLNANAVNANSGTFSTANIPDLNASKITAGDITADRMKVNSISAVNGNTGTLKINAGKLDISGVITAINNNGTTTIDGGKITASSIGAGKIKVSELLTLGPSGGAHVNITGNGLDVFGNNGATKVASFGSSATIGASNSYNIQIEPSTIGFYKNGANYCSLASTASGTRFGYYGESSGGVTYGNWMYFGASSSPYIHLIVGNGSQTPRYLYLEDDLYWSGHVTIPSGYSFRGKYGNANVSMLHVGSDGTIYLGNTSYDVYVSSNTFSGNKSYSTSDLRLKRNINYLDSRSYDLIMKLKPFEFDWDRSNDKSLAEGKCFGLGAQDVDKAMTEAGYKTSDYGVVGKTPDGYYAVSYTELIPHLINVVQRQHKEIEALKKTVKEAA